ncbi:MAG: epimerase, partial [Desulfobulbaceae bacterium]|nr:epimerase [Desulfobulbaceae bacterium]
VNNDRALATGLTFRPIEDTAKDMIANLDNHTVRKELRSGFDFETEAALLKKWHAVKAS